MPTFNAATTTNPAPLGYIKPTPDTPLPVTSNFSNLSGVTFKSLSIQAHPGNGGNIYVLSSSAAKDTVNGTNVVAVLAPGQSIPVSGPALGGILPAGLYIDADAVSCIAIILVYSAS